MMRTIRNVGVSTLTIAIVFVAFLLYVRYSIQPAYATDQSCAGGAIFSQVTNVVTSSGGWVAQGVTWNQSTMTANSIRLPIWRNGNYTDYAFDTQVFIYSATSGAPYEYGDLGSLLWASPVLPKTTWPTTITSTVSTWAQVEIAPGLSLVNGNNYIIIIAESWDDVHLPVEILGSFSGNYCPYGNMFTSNYPSGGANYDIGYWLATDLVPTPTPTPTATSTPTPTPTPTGVPISPGTFRQGNCNSDYGTVINTTSTLWEAQLFRTGGTAYAFDTVKLLLTKEGAITGNILIDIYAVDGSFKPTGASLGHAEISSANLLTVTGGNNPGVAGANNDFLCSSSQTNLATYLTSLFTSNLATSTTYAIVVRRSTTGGSAARWWTTGTITTDNTNRCWTSDNSGVTWNDAYGLCTPNGGGNAYQFLHATYGDSVPTPTPTPTRTPTPTPTRTPTPIPVLVSPTSGASGLLTAGANSTNSNDFVFRLIIFIVVLIAGMFALFKVNAAGGYYLLGIAVIVFAALLGNWFDNFLAQILLAVVLLVMMLLVIQSRRGQTQ